MPFLVYGTARQRHITHVLTAFPNVHLSADQVEIQGFVPKVEGPIYAHLNYSEIVSHPFLSTFPVVPANFFFRPDITLASAKFTADREGQSHLGTGTIKLTKNVYVDTHWLNLEPTPEGQKADKTSGAYPRARWFAKNLIVFAQMKTGTIS
jgi:hypothetical protein